MANYLRRLFAWSHELPYGDCFIAWSFRDPQSLEDLRARLPPSVNPVVLEGIPERPDAMLSNELMAAIRRCDSLVYVRGGNAVESRWITLERDYALRIGKGVYCFDADTLVLERDRARPARLAVFPSYSRKEGPEVEKLIRFMRRERSFDLFHEAVDLGPGANWAETIERALTERLEAGGYLVVFWSATAAASLWIKREVAFAASRYPHQILVAPLEPAQLPPELDVVRCVPLYVEGWPGISDRAADSLMVEIYWLIYQRQPGANAVAERAVRRMPGWRRLRDFWRRG